MATSSRVHPNDYYPHALTSQPTTEFRTFFANTHAIGTVGKFPGKKQLDIAKYLPDDLLFDYLSPETINRFVDSIYPNEGQQRVHIRIVLEKYRRVFATLLYIGRGNKIEDFAKKPDLEDGHLPFVQPQPPIGFPEERHDRFFDQFKEAQWKFCVPMMEYWREVNWHEDTILPFKRFEEELGKGNSGTAYLIKIHPSHDLLRKDKASGLSRSSGVATGAVENSVEATSENAHCYVLKTFSRRSRSRDEWSNEIKSHVALRTRKNLAQNDGIIKFHGCYTHGPTINVLLERAPLGNLEQYFENNTPPRNNFDILQLYESFLHLLTTLKIFSSLEFSDHSKYQMCHFDIKPTNILLFPGPSGKPYDVQFKIGDFGSSVYNVLRRDAAETYHKYYPGTRTYGAPECYRYDPYSDQNLPPELVSPNVDLWSFGCIASELATWVMTGMTGLKMYRLLRKVAHGDNQKFQDTDCFHNGYAKLDCIKNHHQHLILKPDPCNATTAVIGLIDEHMLQFEPGHRMAPQPLMYKAQETLEKVRKLLISQVEESSPSFQSQQGLSRQQPEREYIAPPVQPEAKVPGEYMHNTEVPADRTRSVDQNPKYFGGHQHPEQLRQPRFGMPVSQSFPVTKSHYDPNQSNNPFRTGNIQKRNFSSSRPSTGLLENYWASQAVNPTMPHLKQTDLINPVIDFDQANMETQGKANVSASGVFIPNERHNPSPATTLGASHLQLNGSSPSARATSQTRVGQLGKLSYSSPAIVSTSETSGSRDFSRTSANSFSSYDPSSHPETNQAQLSLQEQLGAGNVGRPFSKSPESIDEAEAYPGFPDQTYVQEQDHESFSKGTTRSTSSDEHPPIEEMSAMSIDGKQEIAQPPTLSVAVAQQTEMNVVRRGLVSKLKRRIKGPSKMENPYYAQLNDLTDSENRDFIILIDNTALMHEYWPQVEACVALLTKWLTPYDDDKIDIRFMIGDKKRNSANPKTVKRFVHENEPPPESKADKWETRANINGALVSVLSTYQDEIKSHMKVGKRHSKPTTPLFSPSYRLKKRIVFVLTTGLWQPKSDAKRPIRDLVSVLDDYKLPTNQAGVQFIGFGDSPEGHEKLKELDDFLDPDFTKNADSRDIVDVEYWNDNANFFKMLMGSINKYLDGCEQSPLSILDKRVSQAKSTMHKANSSIASQGSSTPPVASSPLVASPSLPLPSATDSRPPLITPTGSPASRSQNSRPRAGTQDRIPSSSYAQGYGGASPSSAQGNNGAPSYQHRNSPSSTLGRSGEHYGYCGQHVRNDPALT